MSIKKARKLRNALLLIGMVIMLSACIYEPLLAVGAAVALSCLIPHFLYNKCPHCAKQLGRSEGPFCPFCGQHIE
ncbi:hypothetical protein [Feifania hominis]|uniref:Uncharacterized protein n=1 Tax=Feifania hominis TaxID=2763660 RepID=A0A926DBM7_9FIRM|nr:hypothetical protein [Feifania hominis]MBC8535108.1 hypothetical protein [Feifania hominis]